MLPNEVLLEVFKWLDRTFLETALRLSSGKANALVGLLSDKSPMLYFDSMDISLGDVDVKITLQRRQVGGIEKDPSLQKPFDVFSLDKIPNYLFVGKLNFRDNQRPSFGPKYISRNICLAAGFPSDQRYCLAYFDNHRLIREEYTSFTVRAPTKAINLTSCFDRPWCKEIDTQCIMTVVMNDLRLFASRTVRSCIMLRLENIFQSIDWKPIKLHLFAWLTTRAEPTAWNPDPETSVKHLVFPSFIKGDELETLGDAIVNAFTNTVSPCKFHAFITSGHTPNNYAPPLSPIVLRRNDLTHHTLYSDGHCDKRQFWCLPKDADFCQKCS